MTNPPPSNTAELIALVRKRIEDGTYPPGSTVPTAAALAVEFGFTEGRAANALRQLAAQGFIRTTQGAGSVVHPIPPITSNQTSRYTKENREREGSRGAFETELKALGLGYASDPTIERVRPPLDVADILGIDPHALSAVVRRRKMYAVDADGARHPVQLADSYYPAPLAVNASVTEEDTGIGGSLSRLAEHGHPVVRMRQLEEIRLPTGPEAHFLKINPNQPVFDLTLTAFDLDGNAVEVMVIVKPSRLWRLVYEWDVS